MPKKVYEKEQRYGDIVFSTARLTESDSKDFAKWCEGQIEDLMLGVIHLVAGGWKMSLTWDDINDCFIASVTCKDEKNRNHNVCVSSRSDNAIEAMLMNVYKIDVLHKNEKMPTRGNRDSWG